MADVTQVIASGPDKQAVAPHAIPRVQNWVAQCKAFGYAVDNWLKNALDSFLGGGLVNTGNMSNFIAAGVIFVLLIVWLAMVILYIVRARQDRNYQYYYHEEATFYSRAFKYITPVLLLLPIVGLVAGGMVGNHEEKQNPSAVVKSAKGSSGDLLKAITANVPKKKAKDKGFDGLSNNDQAMVNSKIQQGQATTVDYTEILSASKAQSGTDGTKYRWQVLKHTQPHFKLSAYRHGPQIGRLIGMVYALLLSLFSSLCMFIWHDNAAQDQW